MTWLSVVNFFSTEQIENVDGRTVDISSVLINRRIGVKTRASAYVAVDVTDVLGCKDLLELNLIVNGIKSVE